MWINENTGALQQWAAVQKCSTMASHYANLVVIQLHIQARLRMVQPVHKSDIQMGDIDSISGLVAHVSRTEKAVQYRCPKLTPSPMITLPHEQLRKLFLLLDPHVTHPNTNDHHAAFVQVHRAFNELNDALFPQAGSQSAANLGPMAYLTSSLNTLSYL
jgi:hypothetical protein